MPPARASVARASSAEIPPARETFRQTASAVPGASAPGSAALSSIATRTGTRSRTARTARAPRAGSSTSSSPARASAPIQRTAPSTDHAPLASRRSAARGSAERRERLGIGVERRAADGERDPVVGLQRRGLAAPDDAVVALELDLEQDPLAQLAPRRAQRLAQPHPPLGDCQPQDSSTPAASRTQKASCSAPVPARAPLSDGPSVRERTTRTSRTARGIVATGRRTQACSPTQTTPRKT